MLFYFIYSTKESKKAK